MHFTDANNLCVINTAEYGTYPCTIHLEIAFVELARFICRSSIISKYQNIIIIFKKKSYSPKVLNVSFLSATIKRLTINNRGPFRRKDSDTSIILILSPFPRSAYICFFVWSFGKQNRRCRISGSSRLHISRCPFPPPKCDSHPRYPLALPHPLCFWMNPLPCA